MNNLKSKTHDHSHIPNKTAENLQKATLHVRHELGTPQLVPLIIVHEMSFESLVMSAAKAYTF